jgi:hypothetical protein
MFFRLILRIKCTPNGGFMVSRIFPASAESEIKLRDGKPFFIYALACPLTQEVKYVGQTVDLEKRARMHTSRSITYNTGVALWMATLGYLKPYRVILERGINRRVTVKHTVVDLQSEQKRKGGRRPAGLKTVWLSSCIEAKWMKRFRRTILNQGFGNTSRHMDVSDMTAHLTNPPLPWEEGS